MLKSSCSIVMVSLPPLHRALVASTHQTSFFSNCRQLLVSSSGVRREYSSSSSSANDRDLEYHQNLSSKEETTVFDVAKKKRILQFKNDGNLYHEKVLIGYSRAQMCDLVFDVASYRDFLPFCINSEVVNDSHTTTTTNTTIIRPGLNLRLMKNDNSSQKRVAATVDNNKMAAKKEQSSFKAKLEIGYPPIRESYTSQVTMIRPDTVKAISRDTRLFEFLINEWKFHPCSSSNNNNGAIEDRCIVEFYVSFKFRSVIYTKFATLFLDQVFKKMVVAFTSRAKEKYGKASCEPQLITKHME